MPLSNLIISQKLKKSILLSEKVLIFRVPASIKNTETPIFQRISVVLPKVYLGARHDKSPTIKT